MCHTVCWALLLRAGVMIDEAAAAADRAAL